MAKKLPRSGSLQESQNTLCKCICFCSLFSAYPFFLLIFLIIFLPFFCLQVRESLDFSCVEVWRTHDWSHGLPIVRQAFSVLRPGCTFHSIFFPASSVRCIAFRPCLTQTLCQRPYADSPTAVQALKVDFHHGFHASPRYRCFVIWLFPFPECLFICDRVYPLLG